MNRAAQLIDQLRLSPHPEGGFYRETYRSETEVETARGLRSAGTAILFLLSGNDVSRFHRIDADEIWHFHEGGPLAIHVLHPDGTSITTNLSASNPQHVVPKGLWFGASLVEEDSYALVGCTVSPGFEFTGFEMAEREGLLREWPRENDLIRKLT